METLPVTSKLSPLQMPNANAQVGSLSQDWCTGFRARLDAWVADVNATIEKEMEQKMNELEFQIRDQYRCIEKECARPLTCNAESQTLEDTTNFLQHEQFEADPISQDVLVFNVGGQAECAVSRKTLCLVEGSMLASKFSGRWEKSNVTDEKGRMFIDFSPDLFLPLVDILRLKAIEDPRIPLPPVQITDDRISAFKQMANYFGLADALWPAQWEVVQNMSVEGRGVSTTNPNCSYGAFAVSSHQEGRFNVTDITGQDSDWHEDSFRFGLCRIEDPEFTDLRALGPDVQNPWDQVWSTDEYLSPVHKRLPRADRHCEAVVQVRGGKLLVSLKAGDDVEHLSPLQIPTNVPAGTWRLFVAVTYAFHIERAI